MMHFGDDAIALLVLARFWPGAYVDQSKRDADGITIDGYVVRAPSGRALRPIWATYCYFRHNIPHAVSDAIESIRRDKGYAIAPNDVVWGRHA